jgi:hypothetical protein
MRWMLSPTRQNFDAIPTIIRPRPIQYFLRHHVSLDMMPIPPIREMLIKEEVGTAWVTILSQTNLSVNWNLTLDDAVVRDGPLQRRRLSRQFIDHVTNYDNWSFGPSILSRFPGAKGIIRIEDGK